MQPTRNAIETTPLGRLTGSPARSVHIDALAAPFDHAKRSWAAIPSEAMDQADSVSQGTG